MGTDVRENSDCEGIKVEFALNVVHSRRGDLGISVVSLLFFMFCETASSTSRFNTSAVYSMPVSQQF